jgi:hypothetical protein
MGRSTVESDVSDLAKLKKQAEKAKQDADKEAGKLEHITKELKETYGCDTIEEAEDIEASLAKKEKKANRKYTESLEAFRKKWETFEELNEDDDEEDDDDEEE